MLAGPANQTSLGLGAFDSSFVRTGLTPDVSRTGFTPLIAGGAGSFPPPTPNTAALFAIVNGTSTGQPPSNTATITPNTLNALNGVLNGTLGVGSTAPPLDPQSNGHQTYDLRHETNGRPNDAYGYQPDYADNAAASALYLLSLQNSMRPPQQIAPSALSNQSDQQQQHQHQHQHQHHEADDSIEPDETIRRGPNKRKSMDTPAAPPTRGGKKAKAAPTTALTVSVRSSSRRRSVLPDPDDMDEER
jgi:ATF/CREB family transcription factor